MKQVATIKRITEVQLMTVRRTKTYVYELCRAMRRELVRYTLDQDMRIRPGSIRIEWRRSSYEPVYEIGMKATAVPIIS